MDQYQAAAYVAMLSNEALRDIVAQNAKRDRFLMPFVRRELAARDYAVGHGN